MTCPAIFGSTPECPLKLLSWLTSQIVNEAQKARTKTIIWKSHMKKGRAMMALPFFFVNESAGARTQDLRLKKPLLYQLSYTPKLFVFKTLC